MREKGRRVDQHSGRGVYPAPAQVVEVTRTDGKVMTDMLAIGRTHFSAAYYKYIIDPGGPPSRGRRRRRAR